MEDDVASWSLSASLTIQHKDCVGHVLGRCNRQGVSKPVLDTYLTDAIGKVFPVQLSIRHTSADQLQAQLQLTCGINCVLKAVL